MIGDYRHVVTLTTAGDPAIDDAGGYAEAGVPLDPATWHCSIAAASARDLERVGGGQVSSTASHVIRGRYHPGLTEHGRIQFGSRVFEVESVHDRDERQLEIEVIARELLVRVVTPVLSKADESSNAE
jgi:head-tail adaptor